MVEYQITYGNTLTQEETSKRLKSVYLGAIFIIILYSISTKIVNTSNPSLL